MKNKLQVTLKGQIKIGSTSGYAVAMAVLLTAMAAALTVASFVFFKVPAVFTDLIDFHIFYKYYFFLVAQLLYNYNVRPSVRQI